MGTFVPHRWTCALLALAALASCVTKRTGLVVWVETDMPQGAADPDGGPVTYPRLLGLQGAVQWGSATGSLAVAGRDDGYIVRAVADRTMEDGSMVRARLPRALFYVEPPDPDAMGLVRVTLRAEVELRATGEPRLAMPSFAMEVPLLEGVTQVQVMVIDQACITNPPQCGPDQTCGPGGACIDVRRHADPNATPDNVLGACPDASGTCVRAGADVRGSATDEGCMDATCASGVDESNGLTCVFFGTCDDVPDAGADGDVAGEAGIDAEVGEEPSPIMDEGVLGGGDVDVQDEDARGESPTDPQPLCAPAMQADDPGAPLVGGTCDGLRGAYTGRSVNVGYYPFSVLIETRFVRDIRPGASGELQVVPRRTLIALASTGNYYEPGHCQADAGVVPICCARTDGGYCANAVGACRRVPSERYDIPPLRVGRLVSPSTLPPEERLYAFWGYIPEGLGAGTVGWFLLGRNHVTYDPRPRGFELRGRTGRDFEVPGCGAFRTSLTRTCDDANRCDEGADDCTNCRPDGAEAQCCSPGQVGHPCQRRLDPPRPSAVVRNGAPVTPDDGDASWGPYLLWAPQSSPKAWLRWDDTVLVYYRNRDRGNHLWAFVEVRASSGSLLTTANTRPDAHSPCDGGGTCGWVDGRYLESGVFGDFGSYVSPGDRCE